MPYIVPLPVQISEMSVLENSKPFSPGHVYLNQSKQAFSLFEIFAPPWQRDYAPNGTSRWYLLIWSFATVTLKEMFSKYHLIWPSSSFWRNTDLNGASGNTITSNLPCWYLVLRSLLYCDSVAIKSAKASYYHNSIREKKKTRPDWGLWYCYSFIIVIGFWIKHVNSGCHFLVQFKTSLALTPRLFIYSWLVHWPWLALIVPSAFGFLIPLSWPFHPWKTSATHR